MSILNKEILRSIIFLNICCSFLLAEECFLVTDGASGETVFQLGSRFDERMSPCSTFKILLSLMGYDAGILKDENTPIWEFQEGYDDFLEAWKEAQCPQSWMKNSCVWYSKLISCHLGLHKMQSYLAAFNYGNQNISVGIVAPGKDEPAWFHSSPLKISLREQVGFIRKMLQNELPVTNYAIDMTKKILFKENLPKGWKLFGKTGWSGSIGRKDPAILEYSWFVGWVENKDRYFPFAYLICEKTIKLDQRVPRVIHLLQLGSFLNDP